MKAFFSKRRRYVALWGLLHVTVPRPYQAGAWGPQIDIGLLVLFFSLSIGRPGQSSELRISWPFRGEPLLMLRWAGTDVRARWGLHYGDLWLGRVVVRLITLRYALASFMRMLTHGSK